MRGVALNKQFAGITSNGTGGEKQSFGDPLQHKNFGKTSNVIDFFFGIPPGKAKGSSKGRGRT